VTTGEDSVGPAAPAVVKSAGEGDLWVTDSAFRCDCGRHLHDIENSEGMTDV